MDGWKYEETHIWECNQMSMVESGWWVYGCSLHSSFYFSVCLEIFIRKYLEKK